MHSYRSSSKKVDADSPVASYFLAGLGDTRHAQRPAQTEIRLFKAAFAVVEGGPHKLKVTKDFFGNGPFEYRVLDKGFELSSKLLSQERRGVPQTPLTMIVGQGKKE